MASSIILYALFPSNPVSNGGFEMTACANKAAGCVSYNADIGVPNWVATQRLVTMFHRQQYIPHAGGPSLILY
jgi:hypothetical protein